MGTSVEELQCLNEEYISINEQYLSVIAELRLRLDELSDSHDDMKNFLDSTNIATLFLDRDMCVRRFTPKATEIIPLVIMDSGRSITHFSSNLIDVNFAKCGEMVLNDLIVKEDEVISRDGATYVMRTQPYYTINNTIDGVVMTFEDISERKKADIKLKASERKRLSWLDLSPACTKILDPDYNLQYMSKAGIDDLNVEDVSEFYGRPYPFYFYPDGFKNKMIESLDRAVETGEVVTQEGSLFNLKGIELWYFSTIVPVNDAQDNLDYIMVVSINVTDLKGATPITAISV